MRNVIRIGKVFRIEVGLDYSWFIIFILITWSLAEHYLMVYQGWSPGFRLGLALVTALLLFASVLAHEFGHSLVAIATGTPVHSITLFIFGGVAQIAREPKRPLHEFLIASAGSLVSFGLAAVFGLAWAGGQALGGWLGRIKLILALFNLIPGFPLDGGLFLNHGISRRGRLADLALLKGMDGRFQKVAAGQSYFEQKVLGTGTFSQRHVFPDGELVPVSEANLIAEASSFEVRDVENLREHYALTLRNWVRRLEERQAEAARLAGEAVYRTWRLYMSVSARLFETAQIRVHQTLLSKPAAGKSNLPMSRADLYK